MAVIEAIDNTPVLRGLANMFSGGAYMQQLQAQRQRENQQRMMSGMLSYAQENMPDAVPFIQNAPEPLKGLATYAELQRLSAPEYKTVGNALLRLGNNGAEVAYEAPPEPIKLAAGNALVNPVTGDRIAELPYQMTPYQQERLAIARKRLEQGPAGQRPQKVTATFPKQLQGRLMRDLQAQGLVDEGNLDSFYSIVDPVFFHSIQDAAMQSYRAGNDFEAAYQDGLRAGLRGGKLGFPQDADSWFSDGPIGAVPSAPNLSDMEEERFNDMPSAALYAGRVLVDDATGQMMRSNGQTWEPVR